ncbi:MAG: hypothetical protein IPM18_11115 [Phycisphaerales bacterium]|nr:hypothetical protein [Phycisphaerales bacterium]
MSTQRLNVSLLVAALAVLSVDSAYATDNSYVPHTGGNWSTSGNWSLGHCPTNTESPRIAVSSNANKIVTYNWTGSSEYPVVTIDGSGAGYYGRIFQQANILEADTVRLGNVGPAWYWLEGTGFLWVSDILYIGYQGNGPGLFYLNTIYTTISGVWVGDLCYVGYGAPGTFDHHGGGAELQRLYVGQSALGNYYLRNGWIELATQFVLGNGNVGNFEHLGGEINQVGTNGLIMGLNTGGVGTYLMKGGTLNIHHISLAWNGDAYFTQTGGTVNTVGSINIGCQGTHPMQTWYKLSEADGPAVLNVGGNLYVGPQTLGKYEQDGGTCTVTGNLEIWKGSDTGSSAVNLGTNAGTLTVLGQVLNHTGYYSQRGGLMTAGSLTNDSPQGIYLANTGEIRTNTLTHNAGTFQMFNTSRLRGRLAFPPSTFFACNFANNATFQMGSPAAEGGTFGGHLTNNGTFNYYRGTLGNSTLTNQGTVNLYGDFSCGRILNQATLAIPADRTVTAPGAGYANGVENSGTLSMAQRSQLQLGSNKLVNNGVLYAGAPGTDHVRIHGNLENNSYLLPCLSTLAAGRLHVNGDFTSTPTAELRIRIWGTSPDSYDRLTVQGHANLAGKLDVRLAFGFMPAHGDSFDIVTYGTHTGQFSPLLLPTLPSGLVWIVGYSPNGLRLTAINPNLLFPGDMNCDGLVNFADISPFIAALKSQAAYEAAYPNCQYLNADTNGDGTVNFADISPFIAILKGGM